MPVAQSGGQALEAYEQFDQTDHSQPSGTARQRFLQRFTGLAIAAASSDYFGQNLGHKKDYQAQMKTKTSHSFGHTTILRLHSRNRCVL